MEKAFLVSFSERAKKERKKEKDTGNKPNEINKLEQAICFQRLISQ